MHPDFYESSPICHIGGCDGLMRPDQTREKARKCRVTRDKDIGEMCYCDGLEWSIRNGPHKKGSIGCFHFVDRRNQIELYEEYEEYEQNNTQYQ